MDKKACSKRQTSPERVQILKMLPKKIKESLTIEETNAILFEDVWPDSLQEKLKDYLVEE